jgi:hypothetical protein
MKTLLPGSVWILVLVLTSCSPSVREHAPFATASRTDKQSAAPTSTPMSSSQEPSLVFFTSEPGKFTAWLPSSTDIQEFTIKKTLFQATLECPTIFYRLNSAGAIVQYCDLLPESIVSLSSDEVLDQARGEMMSEVHVKIDEQQKELAQDTYPSLVLSGQEDMRGMGYDGTFKARMILVNNRIYFIVMSIYQEDWCNCRNQVNQVVDSLYIEPDLSIPFEPTP